MESESYRAARNLGGLSKWESGKVSQKSCPICPSAIFKTKKTHKIPKIQNHLISSPYFVLVHCQLHVGCRILMWAGGLFLHFIYSHFNYFLHFWTSWRCACTISISWIVWILSPYLRLESQNTRMLENNFWCVARQEARWSANNNKIQKKIHCFHSSPRFPQTCLLATNVFNHIFGTDLDVFSTPKEIWSQLQWQKETWKSLHRVEMNFMIYWDYPNQLILHWFLVQCMRILQNNGNLWHHNDYYF